MLKSQPSNGKNYYFIMNNNRNASQETVSETDVTSTTSTCPYANDLNSKKEDINVLNTEITTMWSFQLERVVIFKNLALPTSDAYPNKIL